MSILSHESAWTKVRVGGRGPFPLPLWTSALSATDPSPHGHTGRPGWLPQAYGCPEQMVCGDTGQKVRHAAVTTPEARVRGLGSGKLLFASKSAHKKTPPERRPDLNRETLNDHMTRVAGARERCLILEEHHHLLRGQADTNGNGGNLYLFTSAPPPTARSRWREGRKETYS